jgi:4-phospho-D-threonate 3-dehydrogenase / 4-phospho-D-erythronate 3-dehydrogenase
MIEQTPYIPILAITMGDPAGIGPEIAAKALSEKEVNKLCCPLLIGSSYIMEKTLKETNIKLTINRINDISEAKFEPGILNIYEVSLQNPDFIKPGVISAEAGDLAFRSVKTAIDLAIQGDVDGTVTGPINKEAINLAGHHFSGHTEIYAHFTNTKKYAMLLADEGFRVIHVTTHVPLRKACDLIKKDRIIDVINLLNNALNDLGIEKPRIGVAGLNPHAGDGGLFGFEEIEEIAPAVEEAKKAGILAEGPIPPDTLFSLANGGKFDGCVAMYHDQGHIPFKLLGFTWDQQNKTMKSVKGVNITLGLPIIRTSVDHGTAFEIAGKGIASPDALINAIEYAVKLCKKS